MSDYTCALCTGREATTSITSRPLASLVVQEARLAIPDPDIVIPVCAECAGMIESAVHRKRNADTPAEQRAAIDRLEYLARELNGSVIEDAST